MEQLEQLRLRSEAAEAAADGAARDAAGARELALALTLTLTVTVTLTLTVTLKLTRSASSPRPSSTRTPSLPARMSPSGTGSPTELCLYLAQARDVTPFIYVSRAVRFNSCLCLGCVSGQCALCGPTAEL